MAVNKEKIWDTRSETDCSRISEIQLLKKNLGGHRGLVVIAVDYGARGPRFKPWRGLNFFVKKILSPRKRHMSYDSYETGWCLQLNRFEEKIWEEYFKREWMCRRKPSWRIMWISIKWLPKQLDMVRWREEINEMCAFINEAGYHWTNIAMCNE